MASSSTTPLAPSVAGPQERRLDPRWQRRQALIWLLLMLLFCSAPLLLLLRLWREGRAQDLARFHTGDALFDALLDELRDEEQLLAPFDAAYEIHVSRAGWDKLVRRFEQDPRLWELQDCLLIGDEQIGAERPTFLKDPYDEVTQRGLASPSLIARRLAARRADYTIQAGETLGLKVPRSTDGGAKLIAFYSQINAEVEKNHGPELQELRQHLAIAALDDAAPHYSDAWNYAARGQYAQARASFMTGNALPAYTPLTGFPSELYSELVNSGWQPPDKLVSCLFARLEEGRGYASSLVSRRGAAIFTEQALQKGDLEGLQAMHLALCRSSCVPGRQQFDAYVQITMLHKLALEVSSHSHDPALAKLTSDINNVRNTLKSFTKSSQTMSIIQSTSLQGTGPRAWIQLFVRNRTGDYAYSVALADDSLKWRQAVAPGGLVYVEMQKIQAFDYRKIKLK